MNTLLGQVGDGSEGSFAGAFRDNRFTSVVIPDSVKTIGNYAFAFNPNLTSVSVHRSTSYAHDAFGVVGGGVQPTIR